MFNFVMFVLGLVPGSSKPDLVSIDFASIQAGGSYIFTSIYPGNSFSVPELSFAVGQARLYWGKKWTILTGLELSRGQVEFIQNATARPVYGYINLVMPQFGVSRFLAPAQTRLAPKACVDALPVYSKTFVPRLDLVIGFSLLGIDPNISILPTLRTEIKLTIARSLQFILSNQNAWIEEVQLNSTNLSLCLTLGNDYIIDKGGE